MTYYVVVMKVFYPLFDNELAGVDDDEEVCFTLGKQRSRHFDWLAGRREFVSSTKFCWHFSTKTWMVIGIAKTL